MSKIEVLRVPDERIKLLEPPAEGGLVIYRTGYPDYSIPPEDKPALLAALLEDAGAQRVEIHIAEGIQGHKRGEMWHLPAPEDKAP